MKSNLLLTTAFLVLPLLFKAQTLKTTYYDFAKTKIDEQYYVNANGEKNGLYKSFSKDNGVLTEEAIFVNGELNGPHKLYDWTTGKAVLRQLETYKNNVKHGEAKYYGGKRYSVMLAHGNFVNGKKNGLWTYITKIEAAMEPGFEYYKYTMDFKDGQEGIEGDIAYYYPSNKLFYETKGNTTTSFYPNGKISSIIVEDEKGNTIKEITYDMAGNVLTQKGQ